MTNRLPKYTYLSHFLIAIGVFLLCLYIVQLLANYVCMQFWDVDISVPVSSNPEEVSSASLMAIRFSQFMTGFGMILTALVLTKVYKQSMADFLNIRRSPFVWVLAACVGLYFAILPFNNWLLEWNSTFSLGEELDSSLKAMEDQSNNIYGVILHNNSGMHLLYNILLVAFIPAVAEELLFRGVFMRIFTSWGGNIHWGVWLTGLLFGTLHLQPYKILPMLVLAAILGYSYYWSGSIWVPILIHFVNNSLVVIGSALYNDNPDFNYLENDFVFPIYAIVLSLLASVGIAYAIHKKSQDKIDLSFE